MLAGWKGTKIDLALKVGLLRRRVAKFQRQRQISLRFLLLPPFVPNTVFLQQPLNTTPFPTLSLHSKQGHKAIVTGGTKGIGKCIAESFAAEGVDVAICSRNKEEVDAMVDSLKKTYGVQAFGAAVDMTDGDAVKAWVADMGEKLGGIDVVVSNVSALKGGDDEAIWKECFEIDVLGAVRLRNAAMPFFKKSKNPSFIAISSVSGLETDGFFEGYGAMKVGISFWKRKGK